MRAFVLSGGGAKGAFQVGVLLQLHKEGVFPDVVVGSSVGGINAFGMAFGGPHQLNKFWCSIHSRSDVFSINSSFFWGKADGFYNSEPLRSKLSRLSSPSPRCKAFVGRVRLSDGARLYSSATDNDFARCVEAGACIPGLVSSVDGCVDAGVLENCPLNVAINAGATEITVILCNPWNGGKAELWKQGASFFPALDNIARTADLRTHQNTVDDILVALKKNKIAGKRQLDIKIFAPLSSTIDTLQFDHYAILRAINDGFDAKPVTMEVPQK